SLFSSPLGFSLSPPLAISSPHHALRAPPSSPTRRSSDLEQASSRLQDPPTFAEGHAEVGHVAKGIPHGQEIEAVVAERQLLHPRSEEHTSELQSHLNLVCRLLLEKKKQRARYSRAMHRRS